VQLTSSFVPNYTRIDACVRSINCALVFVAHWLCAVLIALCPVQMVAEIDQCLQQHKLDYDVAVTELPFVRAVLKESLR